MNYFPLHIGDFNLATRHLTRVERSIYLDLIMLYYETEMPIPCERNANASGSHKNSANYGPADAAARRILARTAEELAALDTVLSEFFTLEDDGWHNDRCDEELAKVYEKSAMARVSAEKRWAKSKRKKKNNANAMRTHSERNANGMRTACEHDANGMLPKTQDPIHNSLYSEGDFVAPTLQEIRDLCMVKGYKLDPEQFHLHYESNGWKINGNHMSNWQARLALWEKDQAVRNQDKADKSKNAGGKSTRHNSLEEDLLNTDWAK